MNKKILNTVVESIAKKYPGRIAVATYDSEVTYAGLNSYSNIIGNVLIQLGLNQNKIAGIYLPHSVEFLVSMLGMMKSGSMFLPINPDFPDTRNIKVIRKTNPSVIVTSDKNQDRLHQILNQGEPDLPIVIIKELPSVAVVDPLSRQINFDNSSVQPEINQTPDDNCYVLSTSGTTGEPKTIIGHHKGLSHFIQWEIGEFAIGSDCKIAIFAPPTFDVSLRDIFVPLISGGTIVIPPDDLFENVTYMVDWMNANELTHSHIVPSLFRLLLSDLETRETVDDLFPHLQYVLLAGEPLYGRDVNRWRALFGNRIKLVNLYGPTESTLAKCFNRLTEDSYPNEKMMAVGKPISNTAVLILKNNKLCSIGEIGEIHIKSPFITRGYYNDPELTSKFFIQNPLNSDTTDTIYKTGDMGRYLPDRSIELLGRLDRQVKVNSNRIELGDIESSVLSHPEIHQCYVNVVNNNSTNFLVCYFTGRNTITTDSLRKYLTTLLPDYMIPSFYIHLNRFPLTLNGKIDKRRLPKPEEILYADKSYLPPKDEYEEKLAEIWSKILGIKKIGINNPFFELGGTSLSAIKLISEIYQAFAVNLTLRDVLHNPTVSDCANIIKSKLETEKPSRILPLPIQEDYDLSAAQRRVWFLHQLEGGDIVNNIPGLYRVRGEIDVDLLKKSLNYVIRRHESLRTAFIVKDGVPVQVIRDNALEVERLQLPPGQDETEFIENIFKSEVNTPFQLDQAPLMRCKVVQLDDKKYAFYMTIHHIIGDGLSLDIIAQEMFTAYKALMAGKEPDLPKLSFHYKDFSHWQNEYLKSSEGLKHQQFWHDTFAKKVEPIEFPTDFPRSAVPTFSGKTFKSIIPDHCFRGLDNLAQTKGVSLFTLFTALLKTILYKYTGQNDIILGTAIAGRDHPDLVNQVGIFVNLIALRDNIPGEQSFNSLLEAVKETIGDAMEHQSYPYDQLVNELNLDRTMSRSPLFDIVVAFQEDFHAYNLPSGFNIEQVEMDWEVSRYDMMFTFRQFPEKIQLSINYNSNLFTPETIELLYDHFVELTESVVESPDKPIDSLNMLPLKERELLDSFARVEDDSEIERTVLEKIEKFATENPDQIALSDGEQELTYSELSRLSDGVALGVLERRLSDGTIIALILERSLNAIIIQIGIMKSGNIYLPIDPRYPYERIKTILDQSGCRHIITDTRYYSRACEFDVVSVYKLADLIHESDMKPEVVVKPNDLAYLLFTSGSTGVPKGAMIRHQGLANSIGGMAKSIGITPQDHNLQFASLTFDASMCDIYTALTSGASLFVLPQECVDNPELCVDFFNLHKISICVLPPIFLRSLNQQPLTHLRVLFTAGESPYHKDIEYYLKKMEYVNAYGPTECSICISTHHVSDSDLNRTRIPIGKPIPNLTVKVLDENQKTVPIGVPGELYASGVGVGKGYINEPELTSEYFVTIPEMSNERAYRTGDLVRWLPNGELEYMGRIDKQVKIRGYRIEIEEIEQALFQHPEIGEVAVIVTRAKDGHKQLAAFLTRSKTVKSLQSSSNYLAPNELRRYLLKKLPEYMIPQYFTELESIPTTTSGKIDRGKLDEILEIEPQLQKPTDRPPTEIEAQLIEVWESVLGRSGIGVNDDFFLMGGDSIKAIQIIARLYQNNIQLSVADIFNQSTVADCAKAAKIIDKHRGEKAVMGIVPLTAIQEWFFENYGDTPNHFHQSVTLISKSKIDMNILSTTLNLLISQHDILRAVIRKDADRITQEILPPVDVSSNPVFKDLSECSDPMSELDWEIEKIHSNISISHCPLFSVGVFRIPWGDILHVAIHHLVVDGVSWRILMDDLISCYQSLKTGSKDYTLIKTVSFKRWAENIHSFAKSTRVLNELPYWKSQVNQSRIALNHDYPDSNNVKYTLKDMETLSYSLNSELTANLLDMCTHKNIKTDVYLLTLFTRSVMKQQGNDRISILIEGHGREPLFPAIDVSRTVGWFTSVYPLALSFNPNSELNHCLNIVRSSIEQIPSNGIGYGILRYISSQTIAEARSLTYSPKIRFNYLGHFNADMEIYEFQLIDSFGDKNHSDNLPAEVDIIFEALIVNGELRFNVQFNNLLFSDMSMLEFYSGIMSDIFDDLERSADTESVNIETDIDDDISEDIDEAFADLDLMDDQ